MKLKLDREGGHTVVTYEPLTFWPGGGLTLDLTPRRGIWEKAIGGCSDGTGKNDARRPK